MKNRTNETASAICCEYIYKKKVYNIYWLHILVSGKWPAIAEIDPM